MNRKIILICALFVLSGGNPVTSWAEKSNPKNDGDVWRGEFDGSSWKVHFLPDKARATVGEAFHDTFLILP